MSKQTNMVREKDILHGLCKADTCSVPDGYFASLQARLVSIPNEQGGKSPRNGAIAASLAIAASMAAIAFGGSLFLGKNASTVAEADEQFVEDGSLYEQMLFADALPMTYSLIDFYEDAADEADATLDEYYDYINH